MSGSGSANNSWTILTPEGTAAETLRPVTMGTEYHEKSQTSAPGPGDNNQPAYGAESAEELPVVSKEKTAEISEDSSGDQPTSVPASVTNNPIPSSLDISGNLNRGSDEVSHAGGLPEGPVQSSSDPDSYSDSYTHVTPSPGEPPHSPLSTETLGGAEFVQEEGMPHLQNGEELKQEGDEPDLCPRTTDLRKEADSSVDSEAGEERTEGEPEVRKRRSILASLEQIGRREEEEEVEEFHLPQREDDSGFSVNKCILGALILLGLGTIFFSGIFMDLDEESDYGARDLKDTEVPGKQEWLNPEAPPPPIDAENSELLNKLAKGNEQISVLQAQLQAQKEELKVAEGQAAEGAKERLRWEAVEKENSRLKTETASLPVLQKENERMKKELESFPALQKELETLRSTVTELKLSSAGSQTTQASAKLATLPPPGQPEDSRQETAGSTERQTKNLRGDLKEKKKDLKRDRYENGEHKEGKERKKSSWMEGEKKDHKDGGKRERKKEKHEQGMFDKERDKEGRQKKHSVGEQQRKEKDLKKEKTSRGDEGKPWKDGEGKREWIEKREKKEWNEDVDRKKAKHEKVNEGKQWRGKEENKNWKERKDHGSRQKGQKEWKKLKEGFKESGKEQWEDKDWKEKGEKKDKNDKRQGKAGKEKGERKQWEDVKNHGKERSKEDDRKRWNEYERKSQHQKHDKEWKSKDKKWEQSKEEQWKERGGWNERKHNEDWKKERLHSQKNKDVDKFKSDRGRKEEHQYGDQKPSHTHRKPSIGQPEYWVQQRERLRHSPKPPQQCNSLESCAEAERLLPVPLSEFEAVLQTYLAKAEQAGVDNSKRQELKKLATEFFKDGVFVHDQMSFQAFVEDLGDILEDMVEEQENGEGDGAIEDEMEEFEREVMKKFSVPGAGEREERIKGEWRKESGQGRG
ncbi:pre-B-cell leukemia homeobox interacting protein 1b isoform X2 [Archocentrus centrarchus]|uniref:pre-B-cell leukemia homeobox interacting protein 1b isoform X2 n=1 Tax=Archocentrus centrarchus TaxID=63155 RepID=UPI0011E9C77E|nr:pre-B-cell leukemia transcription factor-interacting protein 1-like isoform X2 [Archocentrus centrarchus]